MGTCTIEVDENEKHLIMNVSNGTENNFDTYKK